MLRVLDCTNPVDDRAETWRVSSGSAAVLGLCPLRMDAAPTTLYLMLGERCERNCAFCAQARGSSSPDGALSRVIWPEYEIERITTAASAAAARGDIRRACFQVTATRDSFRAACTATARLAQAAPVPICVSVVVHSLDEVRELLQAGADRVTLALDAATPSVYTAAKHGSWQRARALLEQAALAFPGHIGTHLIVGLGETEREMVSTIQALSDMGVTIGLFAFTPVHGTEWADREPPELGHYRRIQAALWLIGHALTRFETLSFSPNGRLTDLGLDRDRLRCLLASGDAFRTPGCPDCNRPYYNERPGGIMYNYPRPLTPPETEQAVAIVIDSTTKQGV